MKCLHYCAGFVVSGDGVHIFMLRIYSSLQLAKSWIENKSLLIVI